MSGTLRRDTPGIAEEAAEWLEALKSADTETNAAFVRWLRASPRHVEEFLLITASDRASEGLDTALNCAAQTSAAGLGGNVVTLLEEHGLRRAAARPAPQRRTTTVPGWRRAAALAALTLGLAAAAGWSLGLFDRWQTYTAAVGEQRSLRLADGSLVHMNARSRIAVRLSGERRDIRLLEGEALFKVARDSARPFRVEAGPTVIRALGTEFNVDRRAVDTQVSIIEGLVEVGPAIIRSAHSPQRFAAGEEARIASNGSITRSRAHVAEAVAWRQRRLIFRDSTLAEIADEFNRYNRSPQLVVEDEALRAQHYGGTFDADEPGALIDFLRDTPGLAVANEDGRLVIRAR